MPNPSPDPAEPLAYPLRDFARRAGVSLPTLYREAARGRLRLVKVGSRTLVSADAARAWLAALPCAVTRGGR